MRETVQLVVVSPEAVIYAGEAWWVQIPLAAGMLGVWPGHAPLVASLGPGEIAYENEDGATAIPIDGGTLRIDAERCVLLVGGNDADVLADHDGLFEHALEGLGEAFSDEEIVEFGL